MALRFFTLMAFQIALTFPYFRKDKYRAIRNIIFDNIFIISELCIL
jgi:hypothetical protein